MDQFEQYYRLPQDVVGHDAALLSYWDTIPAKAQLRRNREPVHPKDRRHHHMYEG